MKLTVRGLLKQGEIEQGVQGGNQREDANPRRLWLLQSLKEEHRPNPGPATVGTRRCLAAVASPLGTKGIC